MKGRPSPTKTSDIGDRANANVLAALLRHKSAVLLPFGDSLRYDLVFEEDGAFFRVQSKHGVVKKGTIQFRAYSSTGKGDAKKVENYRGQAEYFGVYVSELGRTYLVPVEDVSVTTGVLRLEPTANKQAKGIRWAKDYEI